MKRRRRREFHERVEADIEILPLMNLFVVLIPMLLLSAVFIELAVIRMDLPSDDATPAPERTSLDLRVAIEEAGWVVSGRGLETRRVPREGDGAEAALRAVLADLAAGHPDTHEIVIESMPTTRYDDIVSVMDVSRETGLTGISLAQAGG